jgi:hypothetical protein
MNKKTQKKNERNADDKDVKFNGRAVNVLEGRVKGCSQECFYLPSISGLGTATWNTTTMSNRKEVTLAFDKLKIHHRLGPRVPIRESFETLQAVSPQVQGSLRSLVKRDLKENVV